MAIAPNEALNFFWIVDSGCDLSTTFERKWFLDFTPMSGTITVGNGAQLQIQGYGTVCFRTPMYQGSSFDPNAEEHDRMFTMSNVLYCPDLKFNLLSISQG